MKKESELDFLNNEIRIGDYVAFARNPYANMILGNVVGFTEKGLKVIRRKSNGTWDSTPFGKWKKVYETILPYQCVKVDYSD